MAIVTPCDDLGILLPLAMAAILFLSLATSPSSLKESSVWMEVLFVPVTWAEENMGLSEEPSGKPGLRSF